MSVVVRLRRIGKNPKKRPHFRISVFDQRRGRDSRFIEEIGFYNPLTETIKINKERGSAGHKGVESIIKNIGNDRLIRFRIGIKPQDTRYKIQDTKKLVLKKFTEDEQKIINETIEKAAESLDFFIKEGLDRTMNEYNK